MPHVIELTIKESKSYLAGQRWCENCACNTIPHALAVVCIVACSNAVFSVLAFWHVREDFSEHLFSVGISQLWGLSLWWFHPLPCLFPLTCSVWRVPAFSLARGGSWLSCQDLPAIGAVPFKGWAANRGSSWIFQAPKLPVCDAPINLY